MTLLLTPFPVHGVYASFAHNIRPSIYHLFKQKWQTYKKSKSIKNTYNIVLDAKAHVRLLDRLHVAHKNNNKIEMIYSHV